MKRPSSPLRAAFLALALGLVQACIPAYRPPRADEPHTVLKIRRVYEEQPGTHLREEVLVEGHRALESGGPSSAAQAPRTDALLIHPEPAEVVVRSVFSHVEIRLVREHYTVQIPYYSMDSYPCGSHSGRHSAPRMCMRNSVHYRSELHYRWVHRPVQIVDGSCREALLLDPREREVYLVELTYRPGAVCALSCYEQVAQGPGEFSNRRCRKPITDNR